jgi:hypothetical protein
VQRGLCAALVSVLLACSGETVRSVCVRDADCVQGHCLEGRCGPEVKVPPPGPDWQGVGPDCAAPCGMFCCPDGASCRHGECVTQCQTTWCGWLGAEVCCAPGEVCDVDRVCRTPAPPPPDCGSQAWDEALQSCAAKVRSRPCLRPGPAYEPEVLWQVSPMDGFDQVVVTPLVIDVDGDGVAEVVATFHASDSGHAGPAVLRALRGLDGRELWSVPATPDGPTGVSQPAAAVLDFWEEVTVLVTDGQGRLRAYHGPTGALRWRSRSADGLPVLCDVGWGAPAVADLDGDGRPEIVCGFTVFDRQGVLKWSAPPASGPLGAIVAVADLDGDGMLEITDGTRALRHDGSVVWDLKEMAGLPAVADLVGPQGQLGPDGVPEVVVARGGLLELRRGLDGEHAIPATMLPTWDGYACYPHLGPPGVGGPPAVGDLNGDGVPEVVVASGQCLGAMTLFVPFGTTVPRWQTHWAYPAVDETSSVTGSALFDFHGGRGGTFMDVIHADETLLQLFGGEQGILRHRGPHCSGTIYENPVVADVDGDGSADIVLGVNTTGARAVGCEEGVLPGLVVLRERQSRWANARGIWNQHAYDPWQVCDGQDEVCAGSGEWSGHGRLPLERPPPLRQVQARANTHGALRPRGGANAAVSDWKVVRAACPDEVTVLVRVVNEGEAPLRAGTLVHLLRDGQVIAQARLDRPLAVAGAKVLAFTVPPGGEAWVSLDPDDRTAECAEEDNLVGPIALGCTP